ncbi:MAG TPA: helix-turn-helix domain-containing protein, partial [Myxococcaceae bacterium]|nr:helix-turn-helix domain-containing protein [Myxococcaceae bacterium]
AAARALATRRREEMRQHMGLLCETAGFTMDQVRGKGRQPDLVEMRRILVRFLHDRGLTLNQIGEHLNRDHTSIHHLLSTPTPKAPARRSVAA